jgi:hypothetical protein
MIELLKIHALVRAARVLVFVARAVDFVRRATCRWAVALADDATARRGMPGTPHGAGRAREGDIEIDSPAL